ncbi:MAG: 50S ribosomal protein L18 [Planctomycetota bacterium]
MEANKLKTLRRSRRKAGLRKRLYGTPDKPRLSVFRSSKQIYAQVIDDVSGNTLVASSSIATKLGKGCDISAAAAVGKDLAEKAKAAGVETVAFDRNGFKYHGRVKALADAAREGGLKF